MGAPGIPLGLAVKLELDLVVAVVALHALVEHCLLDCGLSLAWHLPRVSFNE